MLSNHRRNLPMTLYEKFKKLDINFSQIGLEQGNTHSDYFCTPRGTEVIGWEGVDGLHYCFVRGFEEMVFAVNPTNPRGKNVHPTANSFEDFLRLVLACGSTAAVEQAWMWNRGEFEAFLETYPPDNEQKAVLDVLRDKLLLTPMDDPYGYIKGVQSAFDYNKIPYTKEYYELLPDELETEGPPERPEWKVYFENGFGSNHRGHDKPGTEIPINKIFTWGGRIWHIPAVYSCGKGLVVDFCVVVDLNDYRAFVEKWRPWWEGDRPLIPEDEERRDAENPLTVNFTPTATVNGKQLRPRSGNGCCWIPMSLRREYEQGEYTQQDWESIWFMEHYGLDTEKGWVFLRQSFPWATLAKPKVKTLTLTLEMGKRAVPGPRFTVSGAGDAVPFTHPVTGEEHTLRVVEYEAQEMNARQFQDMEQWEYPTHYTAMSYMVEPELPKESLTVRECGDGDRPRPKQSDSARPTVASSVCLLFANSKAGQPRAACSALHFETPETIEWRMIFYHKTVEDITVDLPLLQN